MYGTASIRLFQGYWACTEIEERKMKTSFEDRRKIIELLVEEVVVTNGKVEIAHIVPLEKKGNLQLHGRVNQPRTKL